MTKSAFSVLAAIAVSYGGAKYGAPAAAARAKTQWTRDADSNMAAGAADVEATAAAVDEEQEPWTGVLLTQTVELGARFEGKIAKVNVRPGDKVKAGDVLVELDTSTHKHEIAAAEAALRASRAEAWHASVALSAARERASRRTGSVKVGDTEIAIVSDEEASGAKFDSLSAASRAGAAGAMAEERRARLAQLRQMMTEAKLRAPFDGTIAARYFDPGAHVRAGVPLVRLVGKGTMRVRFAVPEAEASRVKLGTRVVVAWDDKALQAVVDRVAPEVESASSTVFVEGDVDVREDKEHPALAGRVVGVRLASDLPAAN